MKIEYLAKVFNFVPGISKRFNFQRQYLADQLSQNLRRRSQLVALRAQPVADAAAGVLVDLLRAVPIADERRHRHRVSEVRVIRPWLRVRRLLDPPTSRSMISRRLMSETSKIPF